MGEVSIDVAVNSTTPLIQGTYVYLVCTIVFPGPLETGSVVYNITWEPVLPHSTTKQLSDTRYENEARVGEVVDGNVYTCTVDVFGPAASFTNTEDSLVSIFTGNDTIVLNVQGKI